MWFLLDFIYWGKCLFQYIFMAHLIQRVFWMSMIGSSTTSDGIVAFFFTKVGKPADLQPALGIRILRYSQPACR